MAWEQRGNNRYYYRKERDGSRVKSTYVGRGEIAHMISELQSTTPFVQSLARAAKPDELTKIERSVACVEELSEIVRVVTEASPLMSGFHAHKRQWRKVRHG